MTLLFQLEPLLFLSLLRHYYKVTTSDGSKEAKNKLKAKLEKGVHKLFLPKLEEFIKEMSAL